MMEIILVLAVLAFAVWWLFFRNQDSAQDTNNSAPYKVESPAPEVNSQITDAVTQQPAWHTAPAEGTPLAENALDVNHDGKVNLEDVKEVVKKVRKPRTPKVEKPVAKKAATPKKAAAMTAKKPGRKPKTK